jgi:hypothetical protein
MASESRWPIVVTSAVDSGGSLVCATDGGPRLVVVSPVVPGWIGTVLEDDDRTTLIFDMPTGPGPASVVEVAERLEATGLFDFRNVDLSAIDAA